MLGEDGPRGQLSGSLWGLQGFLSGSPRGACSGTQATPSPGIRAWSSQVEGWGGHLPTPCSRPSRRGAGSRGFCPLLSGFLLPEAFAGAT